MLAALDAPIRTCGTLLDRVIADGHPTLVSFESPGCGPCQSLCPVLEALAGELRDRLRVVRVTDAGEGWLAARWHLEYVPTLIFLAGGREVARIKGDPGRRAIREHVEYLLGRAELPDPAEGPRHTLRAWFGPGRPEEAGRTRPVALLFAGS